MPPQRKKAIEHQFLEIAAQTELTSRKWEAPG